MMRREKTQRAPHGRPSAAPLLAAVCLMLLLPVTALAQEPLQGQWQGSLTLPGQETLPVVLKLDQAADGSWTGSIDPGTGGAPVELKSLAVSGSAISFRYQDEQMDRVAFFSGNYQSWDDALKGVFVMADTNMPIRFERVGVGPDAALSPDAADTSLVDLEPAGPVRHTHRFGLEGHFGLWTPVYILKENARNINDITTSSTGWNAGAHWYVLDGLALAGRYLNGGLEFDTNEKNLDLFGFEGNEFVEVKGWEILLRAYMGNSLFPESGFNPYLIIMFGQVDWQLLLDGRGGSEVYTILDEPLEGDAYMFGAGLGTEYPLTDRFYLSAEWLWRYMLTEDEERWSDVDRQWTNTHAWELSIGLVADLF